MLERYREKIDLARKELAQSIITLAFQFALKGHQASINLGNDWGEGRRAAYWYKYGKIVKTTSDITNPEGFVDTEVNISDLNPDIIGINNFGEDNIEELAANVEKHQRELNRSQTTPR